MRFTGNPDDGEDVAAFQALLATKTIRVELTRGVTDLTGVTESFRACDDHPIGPLDRGCWGISHDLARFEVGARVYVQFGCEYRSSQDKLHTWFGDWECGIVVQNDDPLEEEADYAGSRMVSFDEFNVRRHSQE